MKELEKEKEDEIKWREKNGYPAGYSHFDRKIGLRSDSAWNYVRNSENVSRHAFYPFIYYEQTFYKFSKKCGKGMVKVKTRPICYAAHIDRCIYQYYGFKLNKEYNKYVKKVGISNSVVAYRNNLHKNNIHFAKEAFDFIKKSDCTIIVGDFTSFFDNLDHKYLKKMLCEVLNVKTLSKDWYAVFKNITKYSKWNLVDILMINGLISNSDIKQKQKAHEKALECNTRKAKEYIRWIESRIKKLNRKELALSRDDFKKYKKENLNKEGNRNKESHGIPQGSPISAVLSNVYMIKFDEEIHNFVTNKNGLYLRYSDDFIIILPQTNDIKFEDIKIYLEQVVGRTDKLSLQPDKTQMYLYENNQILNVTEYNHRYDHIDYLGFTFDGKEISLRHKTVSKYYYRMNRKLDTIIRCKGITKNNKRVSYKNLYRTYTQKGRNGEYDKSKFPEKKFQEYKKNPYKKGNFFSYVYKADIIFNPEYVGSEKVKKPNIPKNPKEPITRHTKRHLLKIRRKRDKINSMYM